MTEIKPGMIAQIRITEEPVFILDVKPISGVHVLAGMLSGVEAVVRRPAISDKGSIEYKVDRFFIEELETPEDASTRKVQELDELKARVRAVRQESTAPPGKLPEFN